MALAFPGLAPLLRRELAALSRRRLEFAARAIALALLLGVLALAWAEMMRWRGGALTSEEMSRIGRSFLAWTSLSLTGLLLLLMPGAMGGALAGEREERSLDLLRMTPLGSLQIVLEKFGARLAYAFLWVVLAAPFLLIPLVFGGVTPGDVAAVAFFPVGAAVWVSAAALLASALARRPLTAILATYIACAAYHVLGAILLLGVCDLGEYAFPALPLIGYFLVPVNVLGLGPSRDMGTLLWLLPLETLVFAAACVGVAAWRLGREAGEGAANSVRSGIGAARRTIWARALVWKEVAIESSSGTRRLFEAGLAVYAASFLIILAQQGPDSVATGALGVLAGALGLAGAWRPRWRRACGAAAAGAVVLGMLARTSDGGSIHRGFVEGFSIILGLYLDAAAALLAAGAIAAERARRTYDALIATPLTTREILDAKRIGALWPLWPGIALLIAQESLLCRAGEKFRSIGVVLALAVLVVWLLLTAELGLWMSARFRKSIHAILATVGILFAYLIGFPVFVMLTTRGANSEAIAIINPGFWFIMSLIYSVGSPLDSFLGGFAGLLAGSLIFGGACVGLAWLFRRLAAARLDLDRGGSASSPDAPAGGLRT